MSHFEGYKPRHCFYRGFHLSQRDIEKVDQSLSRATHLIDHCSGNELLRELRLRVCKDLCDR